jgi:hypothetical protein
MNPQPEGNGGDSARGAGVAAAKGALLIGIAVVIGIVLLQQMDSSDARSSTTTQPTKPKATTTTTVRPAEPTTTVAQAPVKTPDQLAVIVLNGGAASGTAAEMSTSLRQAGYTNQTTANNWAGHTQNGNTVLCKPGRDREAVALSQQTALQGSEIETFPDPAPPFSGDRDCVVVVGS